MEKGGLIFGLIIFVLLFSSAVVSAEKIVLFAIDDFGAWWLEDIQNSTVQWHIDNNIPVTLGVVPYGLEPQYAGSGRDTLIEHLQRWNTYPNIDIAQHGYNHSENPSGTGFLGMSYSSQYGNISRGKDLFNSIGLVIHSFIPPYGWADLSTVNVLINLGFHTLYSPVEVTPSSSSNLLILQDELMLAVNDEEGPTSHYKDYNTIKGEIDEKIQQDGVALVLYHMQDFYAGDNGPHQIFDTTKGAQIVDYANQLKQAGYTLMTVEQYYQHIHSHAEVIDNDNDGYNSTVDCNDNNSAVWQLLNAYIDNDKDAYGTGNSLSICSGTNLPAGYSSNNLDCNDNNANIHPGVSDSNCNGIDDNCNGIVDESYSQTTTHCGIGQCSSSGFLQCLSGILADSCTPKLPIAEICNNHLDDNCNGQTDEGCVVAVCGDNICNAGENCSSCSADCGLCPAKTLILRPSGQGYRKEWMNVNCPATTAEWQCVRYSVADSRVYLKALGIERETFLFSGTGLSNKTILNVTLFYYATQNTNKDNSCFAAMIRAKNKEYTSLIPLCVNSSWQYVSYSYPKNPATNLPWKVSEVNALEAGMQAVNPNGGGKVSQVYALIEYR